MIKDAIKSANQASTTNKRHSPAEFDPLRDEKPWLGGKAEWRIKGYAAREALLSMQAATLTAKAPFWTPNIHIPVNAFALSQKSLCISVRSGTCQI